MIDYAPQIVLAAFAILAALFNTPAIAVALIVLYVAAVVTAEAARRRGRRRRRHHHPRGPRRA